MISTRKNKDLEGIKKLEEIQPVNVLKYIGN
jgi:hypothetical protein